MQQRPKKLLELVRYRSGTAMLMQEFYKQLLQQGKSPTAALRTAQLSMWQQQKWHNAYYWSDLTSEGEWR